MNIVEAAKEAFRLAQKLDNIELTKQILDLQAQIQEMVEENSKLKERIRSLEETLKIKDSMVFKENAYWIASDEGSLAGPFCTHCLDRDEKLVHMHLDKSKLWYCQTHGKPTPPPIAGSMSFSNL